MQWPARLTALGALSPLLARHQPLGRAYMQRDGFARRHGKTEFMQLTSVEARVLPGVEVIPVSQARMSAIGTKRTCQLIC